MEIKLKKIELQLTTLDSIKNTLRNVDKDLDSISQKLNHEFNNFYIIKRTTIFRA